MAKTSDAVAIIDRMVGDDAELRDLIRQAKTNADVAQMIYDARTQAGLSQAALAERIGSKQQTISQLESADYEGHSLSMLRRIAEALEQELVVRFVPAKAG
ncbi:helix-turn-helix transcriptional regulator [Botrimarina sp.]|uniref:helix-turn-helix domain-containing protein n=1 Tax=Botrimarina sp. TaxID=2795802 RepID=UPI0032EFA1DF